MGIRAWVEGLGFLRFSIQSEVVMGGYAFAVLFCVTYFLRVP